MNTFPGDSVWADPDVHQAAQYMRKLADDRVFAANMGARAKSFMKEHHSFSHVGGRYLKRLQLIGLL